MPERDVVAEVRAAFAYHDAGMDPVTGCPMCRDDPEAEAQRWNWLRALVTRCKLAETALGQSRLEVARLTAEVSIAERYDREANAKMLGRQCDLARQAETDLALIQRTNDTLRQRLARHEQDIEAAFTEGWNYAKTSYTIADVTEALACFNARRKGGSE